MATYKVLQDIEAEDKLFGPLTLKQFIFAAITIIIGFIVFRTLISVAPLPVKAFIIAGLLPFFLIFGFLAAPIGRDQPNDIWLIARLRYLFKPRTRIWNQDGLSELVTITVPKKIETIYVKDFSQDEVRSRLQALANTVDSRGWAVKNVNTNLFRQPSYIADTPDSDRLIDPSSVPRDVPAVEVLASDDMLDPSNNARAQQLDQMLQKSSSTHKKEVRDHMTSDADLPEPPQDYWFMNQPKPPQSPTPQDYAIFQNQPVVAPGGDDVFQSVQATDEEEKLARRIAERNKQASKHINDNMRVLQPLHDKNGKLIKEPKPKQPLNAGHKAKDDTRQEPVNPAILELAQNDDLNVATIARQAEQMNKPNDDGEVVISLH